MPRKRPVSDRSGSDIGEHGPEVKKQKTLPHRGKIRTVVGDFLDLLSPAAPKSLKKFNSWEWKQDRYGVVALDIGLLKIYLKLLGMTDTEALVAKINEIDTSLAEAQAHFEEYIVDEGAKSEEVQMLVKAALRDAIWSIKEARKQLPGRFSHWMSCWGKANRYYSQTSKISYSESRRHQITQRWRTGQIYRNSQARSFACGRSSAVALRSSCSILFLPNISRSARKRSLQHARQGVHCISPKNYATLWGTASTMRMIEGMHLLTL